MCNQEVKFKLFLETALEDGADMIATGHYARRRVRVSTPLHSTDGFTDAPAELSAVAELHQAADTNKDQTYFLYRVTGEALGKTLFPLGDYTKPQVRDMARERGLFTATKRDSQGICFVGKIGIHEFLSQYVTQRPGDIIDKKTGMAVGRHDGAIFYTLGQRHGLELGGGLPYYVVGKDMQQNVVYVTTDLNDETLWRESVDLTAVHWVHRIPADGEYDVRVRHRAPLVTARLEKNDDGTVTLQLQQVQRAVAAGQSVVVYDGDECLGGGIVS
jgi:tRNA-specific 2-thiouridylase